MKKRRSTYDPVSLSVKLNITIEEATEIVNQRKARTAGTLSNFIRRHGEVDGPIKYMAFCAKSAHTLESFVKKHGEIDGPVKYKIYCGTKESRSPKYFKTKYGDNWEIERNSFINSWKSKLSLAGYIEKYGEIDGTKEYYIMNKKKDGVSYEFFVKRYGVDVAPLKYLESRMKRDSSSLEFFTKKHGHVEGLLKFKDKCKRCSILYVNLKKILGEELADNHYNNYLNDQESDEIVDIKTRLFSDVQWKRNSTGSVSKSANKFFEELSTILNRPLIYGTRKQEVKLFDLKSNRTYFYDCYDATSNTIIEFNGSNFHYHPSHSENWKSSYGMNKEESLIRDNMKTNFAKESGYTVIIVWDFEIRTLKNKHARITEIEEELNGKQQTVV